MKPTQETYCRRTSATAVNASGAVMSGRTLSAARTATFVWVK